MSNYIKYSNIVWNLNNKNNNNNGNSNKHLNQVKAISTVIYL